MNTQYDSRTADKFVVRLPDGLRNEVQGAADHLDTSMNTVFVQAVRQYLDSQKRQQLLLDALAHYRPASPVVEGLQRDLTKRDERIDQLEVLLHRWANLLGVSAPDLRDETLAALRPAEGGGKPCACPGCDSPRRENSPFCVAHRSVKSRTRGQDQLTADGLEWLMQNDGHQP